VRKEKNTGPGSRAFPILILFLFYSAAFAASGDYGSESVFMTGAGSRPDGMGGAFTAVADDLSAIHYNPAGLINIKKQEISLLYYPLYESASYSSASYGQTLLNFGTIAASFFRFSADSMEGYDQAGNFTSDFGSDQYMMTLSYGRSMIEGLSAGANISIYYSKMSRFNYAGFGADLGVLYSPFAFLSAGLMVRNIITPAFSMQSVTETIPRTYTFGLMARHQIAEFEFKAALDASIGEKEGFKERAGVELKWSGIAALRAGYGDGDFTFGAGLALYGAKFDYAYVGNSNFGRMDRFTISYVFGMTIEEQRAQWRRSIYNEVRRIVDEKVRIKILEEAQALYGQAYAHYQNGEYEEAQANVEKSLEWKRDYEPSLKMKQILEDKLKEKLSSSAGPGLSGVKDAYVIAGIEFYEKMQYDDAIKQWEQALKSRPGNKAIKTLILTARKAMDSGPKRQQVPKEQKDIADRMYYIAVNSYTSGDLKGAIEIWKKVLAIDPEDVKTIRDLRKAQAELEELSRRGIE
jgi:tetratricopeptide (TPR) repeat protein